MKTTYQDVRKNIRTWDIFATSWPALFSRIIRLFTKSRISHVWIFLKLGTRLFCVEMLEGKGCRMTLASTRLEGKDFWVGRLNRKPTSEEIIDHALKDIGRLEYSLVGALLSPFIVTPSSKEICSEWVAKILAMNFPALTRWILPVDVINKCDTIIVVTT